jgi:hypothetical protein
VVAIYIFGISKSYCGCFPSNKERKKEKACPELGTAQPQLVFIINA